VLSIVGGSAGVPSACSSLKVRSSSPPVRDRTAASQHNEQLWDDLSTLLTPSCHLTAL
jgi:hypothetical protein